jgi:intraflagellar transport protein 122
MCSVIVGPHGHPLCRIHCYRYMVTSLGIASQTLSFYQLSGAQLGKDRELKYDPCALTYYGDGEYMLIGGSDRKVSLWTKEGVFLATVAEREDWVWAIGARPKQKFLVRLAGTLVGPLHTITLLLTLVL